MTNVIYCTDTAEVASDNRLPQDSISGKIPLGDWRRARFFFPSHTTCLLAWTQDDWQRCKSSSHLIDTLGVDMVSFSPPASSTTLNSVALLRFKPLVTTKVWHDKNIQSVFISIFSCGLTIKIISSLVFNPTEEDTFAHLHMLNMKKQH